MTTNVPQIQWVNGAPVLPQEADILSGAFADINNAFGGGLSTSPSSPQGQLASSETAIIGDKNDQIAFIANQVNPTYASGQWQDAIGYIYGLKRIQASGTLVQATVTGAAGTTIPIGAAAQDTNGYIYSCIFPVTISVTGTAVAQFQNQTLGAIPCNVGSLTKIYTAIPGWDTITNLIAGSMGSDLESRAAFEQRRLNSVAINAVNSQSAILAAVLNVPNVLDCFVYNNNTQNTVYVGSTNVPVPANSVMVSVAGGASQDIANAIWNNLPAGCGMAGNIIYTLYDTNYNVPYPRYLVFWQIPTSKNCFFNVSITNVPTLPANITQLVQDAIIQSFNGQDGGSKARINSTVFSSRFYSNILNISPSIEILNIGIGLTLAGATNQQQSFGLDQLPVVSSSNIAVTLI